MTESDIFEALGIDPNQTQTQTDPQANNQGSTQADTQDQGTDANGGTAEKQPKETQTDDDKGQGANGRGNAEPAPEDDQDSGDRGKAAETKADPRAPKGEKSAEQAEKRRRDEEEARIRDAVQRALAEERKRNDEAQQKLFEELNLRDTSTNKPIKNLKEYRDWKDNFNAQKLQKDLKAGKLTQEQLSQLVDSNPTVREMKRRQQEEDTRKRQTQQEAARKEIERQLSEINKLDPSIKTIDDLRKMDNYQQFYQTVSRGNNFVDAYKLVNYDKLMSNASKQTAEAAKQQALNNARGKDHLTGIKPQGKGGGSIPDDELEIFHAIMPNTTDKEIEAYWRKTHKGGK